MARRPCGWLNRYFASRSAFVLRTIAPTFSNDSISATPNLTLNSVSTPTMKLMYASESHSRTSSRRVVILSTIASSSRRSRRIRVKDSRIASSERLFRSAENVGLTRGVVGKVQEPTRSTVRQPVEWSVREAERFVECRHHAVLRRRDVGATKLPRAASPAGLDGDIHRFVLEFSAEYTAAHHPRVDLENARIVLVGSEKHRTDQPVVAEPIGEPELKR